MATVGPLRTQRVSVLPEPNSGVEDATRAGEKARAGGGAERRRDPPGPAWNFSPGSARRALWTRRPEGPWRRVPGVPGRPGLLLTGLAEPRGAESWLGH